LLTQDSGLEFLFSICEDEADTNFSLTPIIALILEKKPAAGFFVEGFVYPVSTNVLL
jgi:hypothetical protein